jgi:hypothetical protein
VLKLWGIGSVQISQENGKPLSSAQAAQRVNLGWMNLKLYSINWDTSMWSWKNKKPMKPEIKQ